MEEAASAHALWAPWKREDHQDNFKGNVPLRRLLRLCVLHILLSSSAKSLWTGWAASDAHIHLKGAFKIAQALSQHCEEVSL